MTLGAETLNDGLSVWTILTLILFAVIAYHMITFKETMKKKIVWSTLGAIAIANLTATCIVGASIGAMFGIGYQGLMWCARKGF